MSEEKVLKFGQPERPEQERNTKYREAPDKIIKIANDLIGKYHQFLKRARILWLIYEDEMTYRGKPIPSRVYKVNEREKTTLEKDFEIVISEPVFEQCSAEGNEEAAIDFLLCFCTIGASEDTWATTNPEFYGFYNNIDRYGMWDQSLKTLEKKMRQTKIPFD